MSKQRIKELEAEIEKLQAKISEREEYRGYDRLCQKYEAQIKERQWAIEMYYMDDRRNDLSESQF